MRSNKSLFTIFVSHMPNRISGLKFNWKVIGKNITFSQNCLKFDILIKNHISFTIFGNRLTNPGDQSCTCPIDCVIVKTFLENQISIFAISEPLRGNYTSNQNWTCLGAICFEQ